MNTENPWPNRFDRLAGWGIALLTFPIMVFAVMIITRGFWDLLHEVVCRMLEPGEAALYCARDPFGIKGVIFALLSFPVYALIHFLVFRKQSLRRNGLIFLTVMLIAGLFLTPILRQVFAPGEWDAWLYRDEPLPPPQPGHILNWLRNGAPGNGAPGFD